MKREEGRETGETRDGRGWMTADGGKTGERKERGQRREATRKPSVTCEMFPTCEMVPRRQLPQTLLTQKGNIGIPLPGEEFRASDNNEHSQLTPDEFWDNLFLSSEASVPKGAAELAHRMFLLCNAEDLHSTCWIPICKLNLLSSSY